MFCSYDLHYTSKITANNRINQRVSQYYFIFTYFSKTIIFFQCLHTRLPHVDMGLRFKFVHFLFFFHTCNDFLIFSDCSATNIMNIYNRNIIGHATIIPI